MAAVLIEDLLNQVRAECGSCPTEQMVQETVNIIRDFCNYTRAYQHEVESESIVALVPDYDIEVPNTDVEPIAIEYLSVDAFESKFKDARWLDRYVTNWRLRSADDFRFFTHLKPGTITFPGVPTKNGTAGGVYYRVSLRPKLVALNIESDFTDQYLDVIADGARAEILAMSGKPWSNPKRADQLHRSYLQGRGQVRIRVTNSYGNAEQRFSNPRGFA
jgi:hypothetical protein